jgi:putative ABC transport system permease protein
LGRTLDATDAPRGERVAVLSERAWKRLSGGIRELEGVSIPLRGGGLRIVGIMPDAFDYPRGTDTWMPLEPPLEAHQRRVANLEGIGRLRPGVSAPAAASELRVIRERLQAAGLVDSARGVMVLSLPQQLRAENRTLVWIVVAAVGLTYLIVAANLAGLFVIRAVARERATAVDMALGASRGAVVRRLLSEALVPVVVGGFLGTVLAVWTRNVAAGALSEFVGLPDQWRLTVIPLAAAWLVAVVTAAVFTLVPMLAARRIDVRSILADSAGTVTDSRRAARTREILVALQLGLAVTLALGAGLVTRSLLVIEGTDVGYPARELLVAESDVARTLYEDASQLPPLADALLPALRHLAGVQGAAVFSNKRTRMGLAPGEAPVTVEGQQADFPYEAYPIESTDVTPGFFHVVGLDIVAGREFQPTDRNADVAIVNETAARRLWPGRSALGMRMKLGSLGSPHPWLTVVGVVEDSYPLDDAGLYVALKSRAAWPLMFRPLSHAQPGQLLVAVRARTRDQGSLKPRIRAELARVAPALRVGQIRTLHDMFFAVDGSNEGRVRSVQRLMFAFGVVGLLLAALGINAVLAYRVRVRRREIGLRMALGASRGEIAGLVLRSTGRLVIAGLVIGAGLTAASSFVMAPRIRSLLYGGVSLFEGSVLVLTLGPVVICACCAALAPAWRASRTDPAVALRSE